VGRLGSDKQNWCVVEYGPQKKRRASDAVTDQSVMVLILSHPKLLAVMEYDNDVDRSVSTW